MFSIILIILCFGIVIPFIHSFVGYEFKNQITFSHHHLSPLHRSVQSLKKINKLFARPEGSTEQPTGFQKSARSSNQKSNRNKATNKQKTSASAPSSPSKPKYLKLKDDTIQVTGKILEAFPNAMFRVEVESTKQIVTAVVSGKIRKNLVRIIVGDPVILELSVYDLTKGRILSRIRDESQLLAAQNKEKQIKEDEEDDDDNDNNA